MASWHAVSVEAREAIKSLGPEVPRLSCGVWEPNTSILQEQQALITAEPSLLHLRVDYKLESAFYPILVGRYWLRLWAKKQDLCFDSLYFNSLVCFPITRITCEVSLHSSLCKSLHKDFLIWFPNQIFEAVTQSLLTAGEAKGFAGSVVINVPIAHRRSHWISPCSIWFWNQCCLPLFLRKLPIWSFLICPDLLPKWSAPLRKGGHPKAGCWFVPLLASTQERTFS